jgi:integrase
MGTIWGQWRYPKAQKLAAFFQRQNGTWQAKIRRHGWPSQSKTFDRKQDAEAWSRAVEREMDVGSFIQRKDAERTTFADAAERYSQEVLPKLRSAVEGGYLLAKLVERFGSFSLSSISPAMLSAYRDERLQSVSPQTVRHELGMVSRVFKACAMDWGIALPNGIPTALVRKPKGDNARERRLEGIEEPLLLDALATCEHPWPRAAMVLAIETAARQSELLSLTWSRVDLSRRVARLKGKGGGITKSGDDFRDIPLSSQAIECLNALPRALKGRVLPTTANALQISFERALKRARVGHIHQLLRIKLAEHGLSVDGIEGEMRALIYKKKKLLPMTVQILGEIEQNETVMLDLRFHDLRHEATSRLAEKLQMHELMKVTGHKTAGMVSRYYHPRAENLALKLA